MKRSGFQQLEPNENGFIENWHFFTEDLLQINKMELVQGEWIVPRRGQEGLIFDLGWNEATTKIHGSLIKLCCSVPIQEI
ncbi:hypothetical protein [Paenibacillus sp. RC67]|uniref:hypothetical protein n=1 Tax=Paenibacillus sp. RC67 TaxID=3039392 RepID=UPI0024AD0466|nr:hypothetical protein [Paenibacillus sp. RC67]